MALPAENNSSNNDYTISANDPDYGLEDLLGENSGVTAIGDLHGNTTPLREALDYSRKRGNAILYNGDAVGDYNILDVGSNLGYRPQMEIVNEFVQENLSGQEFQVFSILQEINSVGGYENYLRLIAEQGNYDIATMQQLNQQLMEYVEYGQNDIFQKKMQNLENKLITEKKDEIIENQLKYNALYEVLLQEQGFEFAQVLNEYSDVDVLFNQGNHDPDGFIERYVLPHLRNKEQITVLNKVKGFYNANGLNIAAMTNSDRRIIGSVRMALSPEFVGNYFPHVDYGIEQSVLLNGPKTKEEIESLESIIREDKEFKRTTNDGKDLEDKVLHLLPTHAPIGEGQGYSATAAYLALSAKLNVASDTHKSKKGKTPMGTDMVNTGMNMTDIFLDDAGEVQFGTINFSENYDSFGGYRDYDEVYLSQRVEEVYQVMKAQMELQEATIDDSYGESDSKAA